MSFFGGGPGSVVLAPARIVDLERGLYLVERFLPGLASHMYAGELFCLGDPGAVIVLIQDKFSHEKYFNRLA